MAVATVEDAAAAVVDAAAVVAAAGSVIGASVEVTGGNDVVDDASVGTGPAPPVAFSVVEPTVVVTVASKSESVVLVSDAAAVDVLARHRLVCALQSHWIAWPPVHRWLCVCWGWGGVGREVRQYKTSMQSPTVKCAVNIATSYQSQRQRACMGIAACICCSYQYVECVFVFSH